MKRFIPVLLMALTIPLNRFELGISVGSSFYYTSFIQPTDVRVLDLADLNMANAAITGETRLIWGPIWGYKHASPRGSAT